MSKLQKTAFIMLISVIMALSVFGFVGCQDNGGGDKTIDWSVDEHVSVAVDNYTQLPSVVESGELSFTVTATEGYGNVIVKVLSDTQTVNADITKRISSDSSGKYSVDITANTKITVTVEELVERVEIVQDPSTMIYYAGEKLDMEGMEVQVTYATGRSEEVNDYEVVYAYGSHFSLGDTSFAVTYGGITSAQKQIEPVVGRIRIETNGGVIDASLIQKWKETYNVIETTDAVTIYYDEVLPDDFILPKDGEIRHSSGAEGDYVLSGWLVNDLSKEYIPKEWTAQSVSVSALYVPKVVDLSSIRYEYRTVGDETDKLCIVFRGTFRGADSVRVHFYEGNSGNTLRGYQISCVRGQQFEYVYDVTNIVNTGWKDLMIDVSFEGTMGSETVLHQIDLNDYIGNQSFIDLEQTVTEGEYKYSFQTVTSGGIQKLEVVYASVPVTTYSVTTGVNASGVAQMTIAGQLSENHFEEFSGKTVRIDALSQANNWTTYYYYSAIDENGKWEITIDFTSDKFETGCTIYTHFAIVETDNNSTVIADYSDTPFEWCTNTDLDPSIMIGDISDGAIACEDDSSIFYIGKNSYSGGLIIYGVSK